MTSNATGWELHLRHYGRTGSLKNSYIAPVTARYTNSLGGDEALIFSIQLDDYTDSEPIVEFDLIEVMIRNLALGVASDGRFVRDFLGIVRGSLPTRETDQDGVTYLTWTAPEQKHVFSWRRVMWPSGIEGKSRFSDEAAETVVKSLVADNCTDAATTTNDRWRDGDLAPDMYVDLDTETDAGRGDAVSLSFAGGNLLNSLEKVCELGGAYYHLNWQGGSLDGLHQFELTWGRGEDKSSGEERVLISLENGTLQTPRRTYTAAYGTTAVAAGRGEGVARVYSLVDGAEYAPGNDIEMFVDARNTETADGRTGQAAGKLLAAGEVSKFDFSVLPTGDIFYSPVAVTGRRTYQVGDLILVDYGESETRRIRRALVDWTTDGNLLQINLETEFWAVA